MKTKCIVVLLLVLVLFIGTVVATKIYNYYTPPHWQQPYCVKMANNDTLRIAYIGDSWAFFHRKYDQRLAKVISDSIGRPVVVKSFGVCGLTSKEIYKSLYNNPQYRGFISEGYDYCFISAGINDAYRKMSVTYYKESMQYLIRFMLSNNIRPLILEVPDYDIYKAYERQTTLRKYLRKLSILITSTPLNCKKLYRETLQSLITENKEFEEAEIIHSFEWNAYSHDDHNDIYVADGMHLNDTGYARLDSCISVHILSKVRKSSK